MQDTIKIALIYGSARENRFCETVVRWVLSELSTMQGIDISLVDPADLTITAAGPGWMRRRPRPSRRCSPGRMPS